MQKKLGDRSLLVLAQACHRVHLLVHRLVHHPVSAQVRQVLRPPAHRVLPVPPHLLALVYLLVHRVLPQLPLQHHQVFHLVRLNPLQRLLQQVPLRLLV
jgi:hypothetical protein